MHCPLTKETTNLIGARELALMRPSAFIINNARGGIVNEDALFTALARHQIAGAAIDCFKAPPVGLLPTVESSGKSEHPETGGAKNGAFFADKELALVVQRWPLLSPIVKKAIGVLICESSG